jgi:O-antigen/teichoic acid export membrane protein
LLNPLQKIHRYLPVILSKMLGNNIEEKLKQYLISGSSLSLFINLSGYAINFFTGLVLARLLGAENYGFYTLIFTWASLLTICSVFGIDDLLVKKTAEYESKNNTALARHIIIWALKITIAASLIILLSSVAILHLFSDFNLNEKKVFVLGLLSIPVYSLIIVYQAIMRGRHKVMLGQIPDKIFRPLLFLLIFIALYFTVSANALIDAVCLNLLSYVAICLWIIFMLYKEFSAGLPWKKHDTISENSKQWIKSSWYYFIATIVAIINVRADIIMLGWLKTDKEVGIYNIAARFSDFTEFSLLLLTPVIAPVISGLYAKNNTSELQIIVKKTAKLNTVFALLLTVVLIIFGKFFLGWFGQDFNTGYSALIILCTGHFVNVFLGPAGNVLCMTNFEKYAFYAGVAGTVVNILLNYFLIPNFGMNGAAVATGFSFLVWNGLQSYFAFRKLQINTLAI